MLFISEVVPATADSTTGAIVVAALTSLAAVLVAVVSTRKGSSSEAPPSVPLSDADALAERVAVLEYRLREEVEKRLAAVEREVGL